MSTQDSNTAADWPQHALQAWRELAAERSARAEAERDRDSYRELAQQALHALADVTGKYRRQSERYRAILNDRRERSRAA